MTGAEETDAAAGQRPEAPSTVFGRIRRRVHGDGTNGPAPELPMWRSTSRGLHRPPEDVEEWTPAEGDEVPWELREPAED